ncbi:hypothetical protein [Streptomyces sp. NPDC095613]|uniref:hypothetical protein n=1 Tax=Streptomyces sp. NPDC095613 TaxID=3155540 RepID=UPI00332008C6
MVPAVGRQVPGGHLQIGADPAAQLACEPLIGEQVLQCRPTVDPQGVQGGVPEALRRVGDRRAVLQQEVDEVERCLAGVPLTHPPVTDRDGHTVGGQPGSDLLGELVHDGPRPFPVVGVQQARGEPRGGLAVGQPGCLTGEPRQRARTLQQGRPQLAAVTEPARAEPQHLADRLGGLVAQQFHGPALEAVGPELLVAERHQAGREDLPQQGGQLPLGIQAGGLGDLPDVDGQLRIDLGGGAEAAEHDVAEAVERGLGRPSHDCQLARPVPQDGDGECLRLGVGGVAVLQPLLVDGARPCPLGLAGAPEPGGGRRHVPLLQGEVGHLVEERGQQGRSALLQSAQDRVDVEFEDVAPVVRPAPEFADRPGGLLLQARVRGDDPLREGERVSGGVRQAGGEEAVRLPTRLAHQQVAVRDQRLGEELGEGVAVETDVGAGEQAVLAQDAGECDALLRQRRSPLGVRVGERPGDALARPRPRQGLGAALRTMLPQVLAHPEHRAETGRPRDPVRELLELPPPRIAVDDLQIVGQLGRVTVLFDTRAHALFSPVALISEDHATGHH